MSEWNKIILTPQEFHDKILILASKIPRGKYTQIYGVPRGGLIAAVYLSHYCNIELISESRYIIGQENTIIVDDISDTGKTLSTYPYSQYDTATIHYKPRSMRIPNYYVEEINNDIWIVYPYEKIEEIPNREI